MYMSRLLASLLDLVVDYSGEWPAIPTTMGADVYLDIQTRRAQLRAFTIRLQGICGQTYALTPASVQGKIDQVKALSQELIAWVKTLPGTPVGALHLPLMYFVRVTGAFKPVVDYLEKELAVARVRPEEPEETAGGFDFGSLIRPPLVYVLGGAAALFLFTRR